MFVFLKRLLRNFWFRFFMVLFRFVILVIRFKDGFFRKVGFFLVVGLEGCWLDWNLLFNCDWLLLFWLVGGFCWFFLFLFCRLLYIIWSCCWFCWVLWLGVWLFWNWFSLLVWLLKELFCWNCWGFLFLIFCRFLIDFLIFFFDE